MSKTILTNASARAATRPRTAAGGLGGKKAPLYPLSMDRGIGGAFTPPPQSSGPDCENDELNNLLAAAAKLSTEQKKILLDRLALDLQEASGAASRDQDMWAAGVLRALDKAMPGHGYGLLLVRKNLAAHGHWAPVKGFVEASGVQKRSVAERQAFYMLLGDLLVTDAQRTAGRNRIPLSLKYVAACAVNLAAVFDSQFPGYLSAGLVGVLIKKASPAG